MNLRPLVPQTSALPSCATPRQFTFYLPKLATRSPQETRGLACLNSFPQFTSGPRAGWGVAELSTAAVRRLRRTGQPARQLGAHQKCHFMRPRPAPAAWQISARRVWPRPDSSALSPRCTSPSKDEVDRAISTTAADLGNRVALKAKRSVTLPGCVARTTCCAEAA